MGTGTWGQGARVKLARGHGDKVTWGHGERHGRDAVAPLPNEIKDTRTARSAPAH